MKWLEGQMESTVVNGVIRVVHREVRGADGE